MLRKMALAAGAAVARMSAAAAEEGGAADTDEYELDDLVAWWAEYVASGDANERTDPPPFPLSRNPPP